MANLTEYLSRAEAAQRLGLTVQRIGALSYAGRCPHTAAHDAIVRADRQP